jgi:hypothetical protein
MGLLAATDHPVLVAVIGAMGLIIVAIVQNWRGGANRKRENEAMAEHLDRVDAKLNTLIDPEILRIEHREMERRIEQLEQRVDRLRNGR